MEKEFKEMNMESGDSELDIEQETKSGSSVEGKGKSSGKIKNDYWGKMPRPSLIKIQMMEALSRDEEGSYGKVKRVAAACGTDHSKVSRYFSEAIEAGYITKKLELTDIGREWTGKYNALQKQVRKYLENMQVAGPDLDSGIDAMIRNFDYNTLDRMTRNVRSAGKQVDNKYQEFRTGKGLEIDSLLERGRFPVDFRILRIKSNRQETEYKLSMADKGFEKPAVLSVNNRGSFLELTLKEMAEASGITGRLMRGQLEKLKYGDGEDLKEVPVKGEKIRIPARAFEYRDLDGGRFMATAYITVTCSVGTEHMPESRAMLFFWL